MATQNFPDNALYELDNLDVLRGMNSETVDLIATDPPFNTQRNRTGTAGFYVDNWKWGDTDVLPDQWKWNEVHPVWLEQVKDSNPALYEVIDAAGHCHGEDIAAFLCFLSVRLLEMHRILKPTGSLYLHCDHTANAYIRLALDAIFGPKNFQNEIIWRIGWVSGYKTQKRGWIRNHDTIFYYVKSPDALKLFNKEYIPYPIDYLRRDGKPPVGRGFPIEDTWNCSRHDILDSIMIKSFSEEKTGSPDQKPQVLYERIVRASSREGDIVLDPFSGCATTLMAANKNNRRWIGIDRRTDARFHVVCRMAGIKVEEAERIMKRPDLADWLDGQLSKFEAHYSTTPPVRTDDGENAPSLPKVFTRNRPASMRREGMVDLLTSRFGVVCWGCGFEPPNIEYLDLDHIDPASQGGSNELDNRAMLCGPCNRRKSNMITLTALRTQNKRNNKWYGKTPIDMRVDVKAAREWAREYISEQTRQSFFGVGNA